MKNEIIFNGITYMDIESKNGTKVKFIAQNPDSWGVDPNNAKHLVFGQIYTVDHTDIHSWHTKVYLKEVPGIAFSSIWFEEVKCNDKVARCEKQRDHKKIPAQILVWTIVNTDDITGLSDDCIISMAEIQENWKVARP